MKGTLPVKNLTDREKRILQGLRDAESQGIASLPRNYAGIYAELKFNSGIFNSELSALAKQGMIAPPRKGLITLNPTGRAHTKKPAEPVTQEGVMRRLKTSLGDDAYAIAETVLKMKGAFITRAEVCKKARYAPASTKCRDILAHLNKSKIIEYGPKGTVRAKLPEKDEA